MEAREAQQWAMGAHLCAFLGWVIPFGNLLGPFLIWQVQKGESEFLDGQAKEALNFQITVTIAAFVSAILTVILIGVLMLIALFLADLILAILAAIKANEGEAYRYPFCLRLIK